MREDWIEVELGEIVSRISQRALPKEMPDAKFVGMDCIEPNTLKPHKFYNFGEFKSSGNTFKLNQVLYGRMRPYLNKVYKAEFDGTCSGEFIVLKCKNNFIPDYLKYILHHRDFVRFANQKTSGDRPRISYEEITDYPIYLPPLPIQRAIVSKIEALFSDLDNGIANFKKAQEQLKIYRQAVLKKAFEGELTREWREKQTNLPTAEELLQQIKQERQNHYNQQIEEWKKAVKEWEKGGRKGEKTNKPRKVKELSAFSEDELNEFAELPKNWIWSKVDSIMDHNTHSIKAGPFGSSLKKSFYVEKGYKVYGQEQAISGNHRCGDYYVNEKKYQELISCAIKPKDALISLVGTVGKVLILPDDCEHGIINPRLIKISFNSFYSPIFFKYYFESTYLKSLYAHKSHGATMDIITLGIIQELPFPIFSLQEQTQIVQEIERRLSVCDKMEQSIKESLAKAEALRQSILKKAFEGKLLTEAEIQQCKQEADYEPASELLKKIQAEKAVKGQATNKKKQKE
ncbi:MAG: restriction endonuclease subunit S [Thermoflexibacteraceae bacterium]